MSAAPTEPTLRQRIEATLLLHPGRGVALTRLYELLPDAGTTQVRLTVKNLMKRGLVIRHGTMRYPAYQLVRAGDPLHRPAEAAPVELVQALHTERTSKPRVRGTTATAVTWPADVKIQHWPTSARKRPPFTGIDWNRDVHPACAWRMKKPRPSHRPPQAQTPATRTMSDLRPQASIWCMYCDQQRPQAGAQKFRAHHVCRECVTKLQTKETK